MRLRRSGRQRRGETHRRLRSLGVVVFVALALPSVSVGYRGDGVFTLAQGKAWRAGDVAMLADGSVVTVRPAGAWRLTTDGRVTKIPGFGGTGVVATADGGVLAVQGAYSTVGCDMFGDCPKTVGSHRVVRWSPGGAVAVVAGTGAPGFGGDGGPAGRALLNLGAAPLNEDAPLVTGVVAEPDGRVVFADLANRRIREVDAAGIIHTLAGGAPDTFRYPVGLAAGPGRGYLVLEAGAYVDEDPEAGFAPARLRELRPDGTVRTIVRIGPDANDLVVAPDGAVVMSATDGFLWTLEPGASALTPFLRPRDPTRTFDFAARSVSGWKIGRDFSGGLLIAGDVLTYLPHGPTPWSLAALRDTRPSDHAITAVVETTQPGTATLEVARRNRVVARTTVPVSAGHSTLRAPGSIGDQWYRIRLRFEHAGAPTVRDDVPIYGARRLTVTRARRLLGYYQGQEPGEDVFYRLGSACRRFGTRRVDCVIAMTGDDQSDHAGVASVTLERSGIVLRRNYRWTRRGFQRHPRYISGYNGEFTVERLAPGRGGRWALGP